MSPRWRHEAPASTMQILHALADGDADASVELGSAVEGFGERGFGILLLIACLFAAIPIPGLAGGLSGPIVILVGLQMLILRRRPWMPQFFMRRPVTRDFLIRSRDFLEPKFARIERLIKPRLAVMFESPLMKFATGVILTLLGVLLFLPIPFTNYLFALLILLYAIAFIERDGAVLILSLGLGLIMIAVFGITSGVLVDQANDLLEKFRVF